MKKALLTTMLFAVLAGCSKDDDQPAPVVPVIVNPCETTVWHMQSGGTPGQPREYSIQYGAVKETATWHTVTEATFNFYLARWNAGNKCWVGNQ